MDRCGSVWPAATGGGVPRADRAGGVRCSWGGSMNCAPRPPAPHAEHRRRLLPDTPTHIGRYEVLRVLGKGTFGLVYMAYDPKIERYVAIKMPILIPNSQRDFLREARAVADIHHPN